MARRDDLVANIGREKNRARTTADPWIAKEITRLLRVLKAHLAAVEGQIAAQIDACPALAQDQRRLTTVPGIGPALSAVLIARLPELGKIDPRRIASLAGLAPHACDSGTHRGKRHVWGGRADVRRTLYFLRGAYAAPLGPRSPLTFIASRYDPALKAFRNRLQEAGKPTKVAITACARKLLTILNAMFRNAQDHKNTPPERQLLQSGPEPD